MKHHASPKESNMAASLPETGFVRLPSILGVYPVSRSTWWDGVRHGRYPSPVKLGKRCTAWRVEDIHALIDATADGKAGA